MDTLFFGSPLVLRSTDAQALYVPGQLRIAQSALFGASVKVPFLSGRRRKFTDTFTIGQASSNVYYNSFLRPFIAAQNAGVFTPETSTVFVQGPPQGSVRNSIQTSAALIVSQGPSQFRGNVSVSGGVFVNRGLFASGVSVNGFSGNSASISTLNAPAGLISTVGILQNTGFTGIVSSSQGTMTTVNAGTLVMSQDTALNETMGQLRSINMTVPVLQVTTAPALLNVTSVNSLSVNNTSSAIINNIGLTHTNAGTMTVRGDAAVAKQAFVGVVVLNRTTGAGLNLSLSMRFNDTSQVVLLNSSGNAGCTIYNDSHMNFVSAGPARLFATEGLLFGFTPTVTTVARLRLTALGGPGNYIEYLNVGTPVTGGTGTTFEIRALNATSGTNRSVAFGTQDYPTQISLETAGNYVVMTQGALVTNTVYMGNATTGSNGFFADWGRFVNYARDDNTFQGQNSFFNNGNGRNWWFVNDSTGRNLTLSSRVLGLQSGNTSTRQDVSFVLVSLAGTMQTATASPYEKLTLGSRSTSQFLISPTSAGIGVLRPLTLGFSGTSVFLQTSGGVDLLTGQALGSLALAGTSDPTVNIAGGLGVAKAVLTASCTAAGRIVANPLGSLAQTSAFAINNNQTAPAIVSGLSFPSSVRSAVLQVAITINATTPLYTLQRLFLVNKESSWDVTTVSTGSTSGVTFTVGATNGQVSYTSSNYTGFTSGNLRYSAIAV